MKLYHPTLPGVTVDVAAKASKDWLAQGWLKEPPAEPKGSVKE